MKKLLLASVAAFAGVLSSFGFEFGTEIPYAHDFYRVYLLDAEAKTVAIQFSAPDQDVTIPATIEVTEYEGTDNVIEVKKTYNVVQVNKALAKNLTIPSTVQTIAPGAFTDEAYYDTTNLGKLESVTFEKGDEPIELYPAFYFWGYTGLSLIDINRNIQCIEYDFSTNEVPGFSGYYTAYDGSDSYTIKIGADVESLKGTLFNGINSDGVMGISKVEFANWANWYNNVEIDCIEGNPYRDGATIEAGGFTITTATIADDATEIPAYKNMGLKFEGELFLPSTLKKIGAYAFSNQADLYYVEFPDGLEEIAEHAFDGCETLTFPALPTALKTIGDYAFKGCQMVETIEVPEGIESIGKGAFRDMTGMTTANLTSDLTEVADELFAGCENLYTLYLPVNATRIGDYALLNTFKLEEVKLPVALEEIGVGAFAAWELGWNATEGSRTERAISEIYNEFVYKTLEMGDYNFTELSISAINKISFPKTLKSIGAGAFVNSKFYVLEFNEGLETIGNGAFFNNRVITTLSFPSTLTSIGERAFEARLFMNGKYTFLECNVLNKIIIPNSVTTLGDRAFNRPIGEIVVGNGITSLSNYMLGAPAVVTIGSNVASISNDAFFFSAILNNDQLFQGEELRLRLIHMTNATKSPTVSAAFNVTSTDCDKINVYVPDGSKNRYTVNPRWKVFNIIEEGEASIQVYVSQAPISEELKLQTGIQPSQVTKMKVTGTLADTDWRLIRENMISLTELDLSAITNTEIPDEALSNMAYLTKLVLPAKTTSIGNKAFYDNSLMNVT